jgi:3-phosphoshikimate 1-carboxyvinyltransferase
MIETIRLTTNLIGEKMIEITVPGSKSITQRAILCASLANDRSVIKNALLCEDTEYLIKGLKKLGIKIEIIGDRVEVLGNGGTFTNNGKCEIFMGNNGTGYRFLLTLANFYKNEVILSGNEKLQKRPIKDLVDTLRKLGFNIQYLKDEGFPPVKILPINKVFDFKLSVNINASKSSQFVSSMLLAGVFFKKGVEITLSGKVVSTPYINMTLKVMNKFGVGINEENDRFVIPEFSQYSSREFNIEGDFSSASYFIAASFFLNKPIKLKNLCYHSSLQGDKYFIDVLKKMGAEFEIGNNEILVKPSRLKGIEIDMNKMPDMVPTLAILSTISEGITVIKNIKHLRYKETDRIDAICNNLKKIGIEVDNGDDYIKIKPFSKIGNFNKVTIDPEDDHRIAMSFALFKLINSYINISNQNCVKKSFPNFWKLFETLF